MPGIPSGFIDPYMVAVPNPCKSAQQLEQFVEGLLEWSETLSRPGMDLWISELCLQGLIDDGSYPYTQLPPLLQQFRYENDQFDHETICQLARSIFEREPFLERRTGISYAICSGAPKVIPEYFINRLGPNTAEALSTTLAIFGLWSISQPIASAGCVFAAMPDRQARQYHEVTLTAEIELVEPYDRRELNYTLPVTIEMDWHICFGHTDLLQQMSGVELLGEADSSDGAIDAIKARIAELQKAGLPANKGVLSFHLGAHFLKSIQQWGFTRSDLAANLIDSCARILLQFPKNEIKEFRQNEAPTAPQRVRQTDSAVACRTHLTKASEGFRLLFWKLPNGEIEFANVGAKKELIIYE